MKIEYKCPYCGQSEYGKTSKKRGKFSEWKAVRAHTPRCTKNTGEYYIDEYYGPIHHIDINKDTLLDDYPNIKVSYAAIVKLFRSKSISLTKIENKWDKSLILKSIQKFYKVNNRIPTWRDFQNNKDYVSTSTVERYFSTWNKGIEAAGFKPNIQNGYGVDNVALDGNQYRSFAETYFCDNYLYQKYTYDVEPKYPEPYNRYYDWYLKELDLYIELDGGIRPAVIDVKIDINKELNRKLLVVKTKDIYNKSSLLDFL